ncbi:MAG: type II toxin-antitoxin system RelE/ParE family toxin [Bacteroidales bacterium]|nr:type II toxin-antitoxin system RelE/ParE family toxin [Bacteroidales bacterium]
MAKRKVIWSAQAKIDRFEILDFYNKRNGNKIYSQKLNKKLGTAINLLIRHSEIGTKTDYQNIRVLFVSDYAIFYRIKPRIIGNVTIWDCRQDPAKLKIR